MKKAVLTAMGIVLVFTALLSVSMAAENASEPAQWAKQYVNEAEKLGIIDTTEGKIAYRDVITREDFCELAYQTLEKAEKLSAGDAVETGTFADTDNVKVAALYHMGIIKGKSADYFCPEDVLTRQEAATILYRMLTCTGAEVPSAAAGTAAQYADESSISSWAKEAVYAMRNAGIMEGTGGNFAPKDSYTAEQAITTMVRMTELLAVSSAESKTFADSMNSLISQTQNGSNYMFSPVSIKMALAMAANGAEDETQKEILDAIQVKNLDAYNQSVKELIEKYSKTDIIKLNIANSVWLNQSRTDQKFAKNFADTLTKYYYAESGTVTDSNALQRINGWVKDKTNGKIPTIIADSEFIACLVNAVYFKGTWAEEFDETATKPDTFTDRNGKKTSIDFMNQTGYFNYAKADQVEIVKLPYRTYAVSEKENGEETVQRMENTDVNMYLMMSDSSFEPEAVLNHAELASTNIKLSVPKFKVESTMSLKTVLQELGVSTAFTDHAQFFKMFATGNGKIDNVLHKTYINVDENGTEAAAVTAVLMECTAVFSDKEPLTVKFNKPFTFVIRDDISKEILFMGEYGGQK